MKNQSILVALVSTLAIAGTFVVYDYFRPGDFVVNSGQSGIAEDGELSLEERIQRAEERSQNVKGVYMTSAVANDQGRPATKLREDILRLLAETELDAVVIDVKETEGGAVFTEHLRALITRMHEQGHWVIARQVVFKDDSQEDAHPEWYLMRKGGGIWRDNRRGSWLDPASRAVWKYQLSVAKSASDLGFDEIQFDYIRFPSDGDMQSIVYPVYDASRQKYEVLREFFAFLHNGLKEYRPDLILSADLFGYVALHPQDLGIGQRLTDIGENFDYISLMAYPSHYYAGFQISQDTERNLPALFYPYRSQDIQNVASSHPYEVVHRTLLAALDMLNGRVATTSAGSGAITSSSPNGGSSPPEQKRIAKLRPWLQDFDLGVDTSRGIVYDATKVRAQIDAAEAAGASGWLLWSPTNTYTEEALHLKTE